ncbi:MAG: hypothetical protein NTZ20_04935 [Candidatus Levybacteria bacterium]|nr:hypothetical protein [Candidatus Levybacteria bacterium]
MSGFQDHLDSTGESLLYLNSIKKTKNIKTCTSCGSSIKVSQYFSLATTLYKTEENVTHIRQYMICKTCATKIDDDPLIQSRVK